MLPVFYTRCVNAPYNEGHIQVIRMMTKSLLLYNVKSIIFNFRYGINQLAVEDRHVSRHRIEQNIPFVARDALYNFSIPIVAFALSIETLKTVRFLLLENTLKSNSCVINIVNCSPYPRIFLSKLSKVPVILHFYMPNVRLRPLTKIVTEKANLIIASSYTMSRYLEKIGVDKEKIEVVYPPVNTELYKPLRKDLVRSKLGLPIKAKIIMYIGGLKHTRFPYEIVKDAMKKLVKEIPEVLLLVFTPREAKNMKRLHEISGLSKNIRIYAKDLTDTEKSEIYALADVFLFPKFVTRTAIEPPLTVLEAMSSGTPVVVPKIPSLDEVVIDNKSGFFFEQNSSEALAKKLADVLSNTKLRIKVSQYGRHTIKQKASLLVTGAKMVELHQTLLNSL